MEEDGEMVKRWVDAKTEEASKVEMDSARPVWREGDEEDEDEEDKRGEDFEEIGGEAKDAMWAIEDASKGEEGEKLSRMRWKRTKRTRARPVTTDGWMVRERRTDTNAR